MREGKIEFVCRVDGVKHTADDTTDISLKPEIPSARDVHGLTPDWLPTFPIVISITGEHYIKPGKFVRVTIEEVDPETLPAYDRA